MWWRGCVFYGGEGRWEMVDWWSCGGGGTVTGALVER